MLVVFESSLFLLADLRAVDQLKWAMQRHPYQVCLADKSSKGESHRPLVRHERLLRARVGVALAGGCWAPPPWQTERARSSRRAEQPGYNRPDDVVPSNSRLRSDLAIC